MQSSHPSHLFQSDYSQAIGQRRAARASSSVPLGNPIYLGKKQEQLEDIRLSGAGADAGKEKVLDAVLVQGSDTLWTAESGGLVRGTNLVTEKTTHLLLAHKSPVSALTTLSIGAGSSKKTLLISAGWDKCIHFWQIPDASSSAQSNGQALEEQATGSSSDIKKLRPVLTISDASNDFIKALHALAPNSPSTHSHLLLSGGSDRKIQVWDLRELVEWMQTPSDAAIPLAPRCIGMFSEHTRGITSITSLSDSNPGLAAPSQQSAPYPSVFSADSMGRIFELVLVIESGPSGRAQVRVRRELRGPETSVSSLVAGWACGEDEDEDGEPIREAQVWAASNDKTAQLFLPRAKASQAPKQTQQRTSNTGAILGSEPPLAPSEVIAHPDYVKTILPLGLRFPSGSLPFNCAVVTGGADEDLRIFSVGGLGEGTALVRRQSGHWHEVQYLGLWSGTLADGGNEGQEQSVKSPTQWYVISTGLDGSIRRWPLKELLVPQKEEEAENAEKQESQTTGQPAPPSVSNLQANGSTTSSQNRVQNNRTGDEKGLMTAEEEAELEELLMDD